LTPPEFTEAMLVELDEDFSKEKDKL